MKRLTYSQLPGTISHLYIPSSPPGSAIASNNTHTLHYSLTYYPTHTPSHRSAFVLHFLPPFYSFLGKYRLILNNGCAMTNRVFYSYQHRSFDLLLAGIETVVTFYLAYPAAVALGAVLLQTAPARGLPGGRMEAFLRAMREVCSTPLFHISHPAVILKYDNRSNVTRKSFTCPRRTSGSSRRTSPVPRLCTP